ncbi:hypothetical protein MTR_1g036660 [Medicago truncatula]|uniref:Uncharacterized protein n=1 Tax=Medicago truncatula TaxID=3880 RepID=A0A072VFV4_MEDTR|nr:hypothetical protein MTR_1g036660 [Medicago truncatula]
MFISIIKSCINKHVEHLNHVLSLDFEFLVSEVEEEDDVEASTEISRLLGHLGRRSCKYQERLSIRGLSCTKTGTRCYHLSCRDIVLHAYFNRGKPHLHPSVYNIKAVPHMEVKVLSTEVLMKAKLD